MNPHRSRSPLILFCCLLFAIPVAAVSQSPKAPPQDSARRLQFNTSVKPAFRISPLVHRYEAPRGRLLRFEFQVESLGKDTTLQIGSVSMSQRESGAVLPDTKSPPPEEVRMETPATMQLRAGQQKTIRGRVAVPLSDSPFHTFGILVTDLGRIVDDKPIGGGKTSGKARLGVRFITRYLLRLDISVLGASGLNIRQLQLQGGQLISANGRPQVRLWVQNPTPGPFEFEVRCHLDPHHEQKTIPGGVRRSTAGRPLPLVLPVRAALAPPNRFQARILANSRVRLEEFLPQPVFPGSYTLRAELIAGGRPRLKKEFAVVVREHDFPAQDASIVQVASAVSVTPAHVELSLRRRGRRVRPLTITNTSAQPMQIQLTTRPFGPSAAQYPPVNRTTDTAAASGGSNKRQAMDWLRVSPDSFTLPPGRFRKVLVALRTGSNIESHQYGFLQVRARPATAQGARPQTGSAQGVQEIPVALVSRGDDAVRLRSGQLRWETGNDHSAFVLPVTNEGTIHIPLNAVLMIQDSFGRPVRIRAGFHGWLLPGRSDEIRFRLQAPKPGHYQLQARIERPGDKPLVVNQRIDIPARLAEQPNN